MEKCQQISNWVTTKLILPLQELGAGQDASGDDKSSAFLTPGVAACHLEIFLFKSMDLE